MNYQFNLELQKYCPSLYKRLSVSEDALQDKIHLAMKVPASVNVENLQYSLHWLSVLYPHLKSKITAPQKTKASSNKIARAESYIVSVAKSSKLSININTEFEFGNSQQCIEKCDNIPFAFNRPLFRVNYFAFGSVDGASVSTITELNCETKGVLVVSSHRLLLDEKGLSYFAEKLISNYKILYEIENPKKYVNSAVKSSTPYIPIALTKEKTLCAEGLTFWKNSSVTKAELASAEVPGDGNRSTLQFSLDRSKTSRLSGWCVEKKLDLSDWATTIWQKALQDKFSDSQIALQIDRTGNSGRHLDNTSDIAYIPAIENSPNAVLTRCQWIATARQYLDTPYNEIVEQLGVDLEVKSPALRSVVRFTPYYNLGLDGGESANFYLASVKSSGCIGFTKESIGADFFLREGKIICDISYDEEVYDSKSIEGLWGQYTELLTEVHNLTSPDCAGHTDLYELFEKIVRSCGDNVALIDQPYEKASETLSYNELNNAANRLAHELTQRSVNPGDRIAVYCDRSFASFVALLGIWKAGAVYLPLDVVQARPTLQSMIRLAKPAIILTNHRRRGLLYDADYAVPELAIESMINSTKAPVGNLQTNYPADRPSLLLFTSGSTGTPKGVLHKQDQLINRFEWLWKNYPFVEGEVACQRTHLGYQPSLWEMLGGLLKGVPTVILHDDIVKDPHLFKQALIEHSVTHATIVPSLLQTVLQGSQANEAPWSHLKMCITAGEPLKTDLLKRFKKVAPNTLLLNDYGSTETNGVLYFDSRSLTDTGGDKLPGLRTIDNVTCYVLDEKLQKVSQGETGTLYVGGKSLAIEYLYNQTLTAEKFVHHSQLNRRLYCMGDLARQNYDGTFEIFGRADNQVKIRGNRVELEGVENILQSCEGVKDCAVGVRNLSSGVKKLVAYLILQDGSTTDSIRTQLENRLPDYSQPSFYREITEIPKNANGKIDRLKINENLDNPNEVSDNLAAKNIPDSSKSPALDSVLKLSAEILELPLDLVDPQRKFYEIGFDSSTIVFLAQGIQEQLDVEIRVADLYNLASLAALADRIDELCADSPLTQISHDSSNDNKTFESDISEIGESDIVESTVDFMRELAAELLELDLQMVEVNRKFYEIGFDSGTAADFIQKINTRLNIDLRIKDLYSYASIQELAAYANQTFSAELQNHQTSESVYATESAEVSSPSQDDTVEEFEHELSETVQRTQQVPDYSREPIAIIGVSGSYAQYANLDEFWQGISSGESGIREIPRQRWDVSKLFNEDVSVPGATVSKWGGFLENVENFDAEFFSILPAEALYMDPQQRLTLQEGWRAFENAGYSEERVYGEAVGVFVGHRAGDYSERVRQHEKHAHAYSLMGNDSAVLSARLSYHFNLKGPSVSLDTACSSSLVAIHQACQSLRANECDMALAGGVCVMTTPTLYQQSTKLGMLNNEGKCKSFDNQANGIVPGEGVGFVILKTLSQAEKDKDTIHAVIRGSGVNQDGRSNGMTAPNAESQQALIEKVCRDYSIDPQSIGLVETHGTGTKLGDPIEFDALSNAYSLDSSRSSQCVLGAVKANIGHTIAAAGIAGVHKAILAMQHGQIPPMVNFEEINEHIDIQDSPFSINTELQDWTVQSGEKRRTAVSSFGFGGTNAHLVLEDYPQKLPSPTPDRDLFYIPLSAKTNNSLKRKASELAEFLQNNVLVSIADLEKTLWLGRSHYKQRQLYVVKDIAALCRQLQSPQPEASEYEAIPFAWRELAIAFAAGKRINCDDFEPLFVKAQCVVLPSYPFEETRYWLELELEDDGDIANETVAHAELSHAEISQTQLEHAELTLSADRDNDTDAMENDTVFIQAVEGVVQQVIQTVTGYNANSLKVQEPLERIGISSVVILMLNKAMKERFGDLPDTLFFENQTIAQVAQYLAKRFRLQTEKALGWKKTESSPSQTFGGGTAETAARREAKNTSEIQHTQSVKRSPDHEQIAIVGLSGRYPQANNLDEYWTNLCEGKDCITQVPADRWKVDSIYRPDSTAPGHVNSKWGGFLEDVQAFDPLFFNISPKDAQLQDPQERLFLQTAWHALEDAGYSRQTLADRQVGVFVGVVWSEYQLFGVEASVNGNPVYPNASFSSIANRVSYSLNLNGPSMAVDTMCSSSLTAIHLACQSVASGECEMAIAGGVNLSLHPTKYQLLAQGRYLASSGHCQSFAEGGDGYVPGEGVGAVVVKPLSAALQDGDHIYAVVKSSVLNHGGKTNGYTVPNPNAQGQLVKDALTKAKIDASTISYVEAHGTGTELGDPIEIAGLMQAFQNHDEQHCAIGSVKSNIGHLEAAAGIAGLSKILLQMKYGMLVPSLLEGEVNKKIDFEATPFRLQTELDAWPQSKEHPLRAAISAFGAGGSNAHLIVEAYEEQTVDAPRLEQREHLIVLSARRESQLQSQVEQLHHFIQYKQEPVWTLKKVSDCIRLGLAEILDVDSQHIDLHDTLHDYFSEKGDIERLLMKLEALLPMTVSLSAVDTRTPLNILAEGLFDQCGSIGEEKIQDAYSLANIAYTLQVGREPFEHRAAFVVSSLAELEESLALYCVDKGRSTAISGSILDNSVDMSAWLNNRAGHQFVRQLIEQKSYRQVAQMWVAGIAVDWAFFYAPDGDVKRVSLPVYPFDKQHYWYDQAIDVSLPKAQASSVLHPLLHLNCSDLREQKFQTQLSDHAFFLDDHRVGGEPTLPGVAYLEMMLTAVAHSLDDKVASLTNIVFAQPISFDENGLSSQIVVKVTPDADILDIRVEAAEGDLYSKSRYSWSELDEPLPSVNVDLSSLLAQTNVTLNSQQCYQTCRKANMQYGPTFQVLEGIAIADNFAIGDIRLPDACNQDDFQLHPSVMDGGLQTLLVLMDHIEHLKDRRFLPYSIKKISCFSPLPQQCRALVRTSNESPDNPEFDVFYLNADSEVVISIKGLVLRAATGARADNELLYYRYQWQQNELPSTPALSVTEASAEDAAILVLMPSRPTVAQQQTLKAVAERVPGARLYFAFEGDKFQRHSDKLFELSAIVPNDYVSVFAAMDQFPLCIVSLLGLESSPLTKSYEHATAAMNCAQSLMRQLPAQTEAALMFMYRDGGKSQGELGQTPYHALGGLAKTIRIENPRVRSRCVALDDSVSFEQALHVAVQEYLYGEEYVSEVCYTANGRETKLLVEAKYEPEATLITPSTGGVVLITGGMGKLGLVCADWVFARQPEACVVLCGRSAPSAEAAARIDAWRSEGKRVHIEQADFTSANQCRQLIENISRQIAEPTGILHCAGAIRDALLINKSADDIEAVLAPKIQGAINLDEVCSSLTLDYFICFSSIAAVLGNPGQTDYAYASSYLDNFAIARDALVKSGQRHGRTISINWPLWLEGGMKMDPQAQKRMREQWGVVPLPTDLGLSMLDEAMAQTAANFIFVYGVSDKLRQSMHINDDKAIYGRRVAVVKPAKSTDTQQPAQSSENTGVGDTLTEAKRYVAQLLSDAVKVPVADLDEDADFDRYGVDSVVITDLNSAMESTFDDLPQTLFFEYQSISALAEFLSEQYSNSFTQSADAREGAPNNSKELVSLSEPNQSSQPSNQTNRFVAASDATSISVQHEDIAIIGMSGRYPQAKTLAQFWDNLTQGQNCVEQIPSERWDWQEYFDSERSKPGKAHSKWGGFIHDVDKFDPLFFNISPAEAEQMDPQERICIELIWQLLEDAGYTRSSLKKTQSDGRNSATGLFIGSMYKHYPWLARNVDAGPFLAISSYWNITNRVSYLFDFQGPSIAVDTACASSLTAVHMACESIRQGKCTTAVAGGVNLTLHPDKFVGLAESGMLSSENASRGMGRGDGYVSGEGAGMVLLKPLSLAQADGDQINAVIKGSAINHGGKSNSFATPNPRAQTQVVELALQDAGVSADQISYVETACNGAELGDMIEFNALDSVYRQATDQQNYCAMGTVKSNIGHLEAASGISQLTKVICQLKNKTLVPSINAEPLNEKISFDASPFRLQTEHEPWTVKDGEPRYAAVNSIGAGGANAHVILSEYTGDQSAPIDATGKAYPFLISARSVTQVAQLAEALAAQLKLQPLSLIDSAYTLAVGREFHGCRLALYANDKDELVADLENISQALFQSDTDLSQIARECALSTRDSPVALTTEHSFAGAVNDWLSHKNVDWKMQWQAERGKRVSLPSYPFERNSYWIPGFNFGDRALVSSQRVQPTASNGLQTNQGNDQQYDQAINTSAVSPSAASDNGQYPQLTQFLRNELSQQLKLAVNTIGTNQDLTELGFDSLQGMRFLNRLQQYFGKKLVASELIGVTMLEGLADYLISNGYIDTDSVPDGLVVENSSESTENELDDQLLELLSKLESGEISSDEAAQAETSIQQQQFETKSWLK